MTGRSSTREAATRTRARRSPEQARSLILAAAERVLSERGPDAAGLASVAREAGVSHGLVSHYFGTYDGLVEAVFEAYVARVRSRLIERVGWGSVAEGTADVEGALTELFAALAEPTYARLAVWALLSGRLDHRDFFPRRRRGLELVVDALESSLAEARSDRAPSRAALELMVVHVLSAIVGYVAAGATLWGSIGADQDARRDQAFVADLARVVRAVLGWEKDERPTRRRR